MEKIPSLFVRDFQGDCLATPRITPGCEWVNEPLTKAVASYKWDGTAIRIKGGEAWKRYDARAFTVDKKTGKRNEYPAKPAPVGFEPCQQPDEITGHWPGWIPAPRENPENRWLYEAIDHLAPLADGTYELIGPKINTNRDRAGRHMLMRHGAQVMENAPKDYAGLREYLSEVSFEGLVFTHPDGRMCKVKKSDFFTEVSQFKIDRYTPEITYEGCCGDDPGRAELKPDEFGYCVKWDDVKPLLAELSRLRVKAKRSENGGAK